MESLSSWLLEICFFLKVIFNVDKKFREMLLFFSTFLRGIILYAFRTFGIEIKAGQTGEELAFVCHIAC